MSRHGAFDFLSAEDLLGKAEDLHLTLPFENNLSLLFQPFSLNSHDISNRLVVHPMEGFDAEPDGSPGDLTRRRYRRFARGGSSIIWFEAASVCSGGRSNPHQLYLHEKNVDDFKALVEMTRKEAREASGFGHRIICILQLTHSGRYSRPEIHPQPLVAAANPHLDNKFESVRILSDDELEEIGSDFFKAAVLADEAGFDGVDIKACHGYLINELLGAHTRPGRYGGDFAGRTRFLIDAVKTVHEELPGFLCAVRLSAFDGLPFPYGFGVQEGGSVAPDLNEPEKLIAELRSVGLGILSLSLGIPYINPHYGRPYDRPLPGSPSAPEHPLEGIARLIGLTSIIQRTFPEIPVVGAGYSWLREFWPNVAAAVLRDGGAALIGLGRSSIAYPDGPKDLFNNGCLDRRKVCLSCSRCTELMRAGHVSGCVVRDKKIYAEEFRKISENNRV